MNEMTLQRVLEGVTRLDVRFDRQEGRLVRLEGRFDRAEGRFDGLEGRLTKLETGQARLRVDLMERLDRLDNALSAMIDDIAVSFAAIEKARRLSDNTRDEVRGLSGVVAALTCKMLSIESQMQEYLASK